MSHPAGGATVSFVQRVPNVLAYTRMVLVPVVMVLVLRHPGDGPMPLAAGLFVFAAVTDLLDGWVARRWKVESILGAFLDTTADKLLVAGSLLALLAVDRVNIWLALVIIMREFLVMAFRSLSALGGVTIPPSRAGKWKAVVQFVAIAAAMLRSDLLVGGAHPDEWLMGLAAALSVVSAIAYLRAFRHVAVPR